MAKNSKYKDKFEDSLGLIKSTLEWAEKQDVERLRRFIVDNANIPLYCISSGGSSASNDYLALLYETNKAMAKSLTPLGMASISDEALKSAKIIITSGGGHGADEEYTANRAAKLNPKGVCGITSKNDGKNVIINTLKKVTTNWFLYNTPSQSGFLGTNSIIALFGLFYKTFTNDSDFVSKLDMDLSPTNCFTYRPRVEGNIPTMREIKNYVVLYGGWGRPVAIDFENKMIESGIASVQLCDIRNFCHGRFIFISKHLEDSALVLLLSPREKEFATRLILEAKTFRGNQDVFPKNTAIMTIETEHDNPLASIDLMIKMQVCFNEIAKANKMSDDDDPCNPDNPHGIDKRFPRSLTWGNMAEMEALNHGNSQGTVGTIKGVGRKKKIDYDPTKSIEELADTNEVSIPTIRKFIIEKNIDRKRDEKMNTYNKIWLEYIKDSGISNAALAKKLKKSVNTIKDYLGKEAKDIKTEDGKVAMAVEHPTVTELREDLKGLRKRFEDFCKVRDKYPNLTVEEYLKKLHLTANKGNVKMMTDFMQMKVFMYKFKDKEIEFIHNG